MHFWVFEMKEFWMKTSIFPFIAAYIIFFMWDVLFLEEAKSKLKRTVFTFDYLSVNPLFKKLAAEQSLKAQYQCLLLDYPLSNELE